MVMLITYAVGEKGMVRIYLMVFRMVMINFGVSVSLGRLPSLIDVI